VGPTPLSGNPNTAWAGVDAATFIVFQGGPRSGRLGQPVAYPELAKGGNCPRITLFILQLLNLLLAFLHQILGCSDRDTTTN
jgi:hypothetical protein